MKVKHFKIAYKSPPTLDVCHLTQFGKVPQKVPQLWVIPPSSSVVPEISIFTLAATRCYQGSTGRFGPWPPSHVRQFRNLPSAFRVPPSINVLYSPFQPPLRYPCLVHTLTVDSPLRLPKFGCPIKIRRDFRVVKYLIQLIGSGCIATCTSFSI